MKSLNIKYDHHNVEKGKYHFWLENGYFSAGDLSKKPFTIVIPPPNVTGRLHLGHTWDNTLQDIIIRRKRMQGFDALYLPGMDHAGIATQAKIDSKLKSMGINRYELGREKYLDHAWNWKEEYAGFIRSQWESMGLSLDYSKERFTLDAGLSDAVHEVFIKLYQKGYIYRGERIINWDVEAKTALSNIEIEHFEIEGALYHITYPFVDGNGGLTVATTRPETMFGDVALMVNPNDSRYQSVVGKKVFIPTTKRSISVIADEFVDMDFGTGIVKVTPAHDPNDFEVGKRHHLPMPLCMKEDGTMNELAGIYESMERFACRKQLVKDLEKLQLLVTIEKHIHSVGHSERTGVIAEPRLSKQWFVRMDQLAKNALEKNQVAFVPERFNKTFLNWMENIEDWCISRQLWWGHRIPVWYRGDEIYCGLEAPTEAGWHLDEDVLDTWFSSALWPFSTLGWPKESDDYKRFFPTDVLVTGYDIIFFWVARMIFQSIEFTEQSPFRDCLIHGLIRDADGRKMSKSLGNGIDPFDVIEKYGADALRYFISTNSSPGQDLRYEEEKVESSWNFINKLWNISRYVLMNTEGVNFDEIKLDPSSFNLADRWIIEKLDETIVTVDQFSDRYEFGEAAKALYNFTWNDFAAWYLEMAKLANDKPSTKSVLLHVLTSILKMLHPYMPFVTEEIYQLLPKNAQSIMISSWPTVTNLSFENTKSIEVIFEIIRRCRQIRNDYNVPLSKPIDVIIKTDSFETSRFLIENDIYLDKFINPKSLIISESIEPIEEAITIIHPQATVYLPLGSLVDIPQELAKLEKELVRLTSEITRSEAMLTNENFLRKAPQSKIDAEKEKLKGYLESHNQTQARIEALKK
jgi:valyl-tRNA synthetase